YPNFSNCWIRSANTGIKFSIHILLGLLKIRRFFLIDSFLFHHLMFPKFHKTQNLTLSKR
ncbi:hypothetical protein L9F63_013545, partial [Diploptera punctata]